MLRPARQSLEVPAGESCRGQLSPAAALEAGYHALRHRLQAGLWADQRERGWHICRGQQPCGARGEGGEAPVDAQSSACRLAALGSGGRHGWRRCQRRRRMVPPLAGDPLPPLISLHCHSYTCRSMNAMSSPQRSPCSGGAAPAAPASAGRRGQQSWRAPSGSTPASSASCTHRMGSVRGHSVCGKGFVGRNLWDRGGSVGRRNPGQAVGGEPLQLRRPVDTPFATPA